MNRTNQPLYIQLANNIKKKIINGTYDVGSKIPSEREMASMYEITRVTVRRALDNLIKEGILVPVVGSGTYVAKIPTTEKKINLGEGSSSRLASDIRSGGMNPTKSVLDIAKVKTPDHLKEYYKNEDLLFKLVRLMKIDDNPYAVQVAYLPLSIFETADRCDFKTMSLYDYMDSVGHVPKKIESILSIINLPNQFKKPLRKNNDSKVFYFRYFGYDKNNTLVEYTESYNLPEYTEYRFTIKRF